MWTRTSQSDELTIYRSDKYVIKGYGRLEGRKLIRDWKLFFDDEQVSVVSKLAEAKLDAEIHAEQQRRIHKTRIFTVAVKSPADFLTYRSFHHSQDGAQKVADVYNENPDGPRAFVHPVIVVE